jgi:hypothetical protein
VGSCGGGGKKGDMPSETRHPHIQGASGIDARFLNQI